MKIAYGNSRMEKKWKNNDISWDDFIGLFIKSNEITFIIILGV